MTQEYKPDAPNEEDALLDKELVHEDIQQGADQSIDPRDHPLDAPTALHVTAAGIKDKKADERRNRRQRKAMRQRKGAEAVRHLGVPG